MVSHAQESPVVDAVLRQFKLKGQVLDLYVEPESLFVPNAVSRLFSKVVSIGAGDTVFDIGTGTGVLAVWAARGACKEVHAVDPVGEHCALAARNARLHQVADRIRIYQGNLFDPLPSGLKAEVVIGDVSGIADGPGKALGWYSTEVPTGGGDGAEVVTGLLRQVHEWLADAGKLYFPVAVGLSDDRKVMDVAKQCFAGLRRVVDVWFPLSEEEYEIVACCLPPDLLGRLRKRGSRMAWNGHIYEAAQPRQSCCQS